MTNSERAEKIVEEMPDYARDQIPFIIFQLDEAVKEAIVEKMTMPTEEVEKLQLQIRDEWIAEGFATAQEKAARIAEKGPGPGGIIKCDGDVGDPGVVVTGYQKWIAERIRNMIVF